MQLPISIDVTDKRSENAPSHPFTEKWQVDARCEHAETEIKVMLDDYGAMGRTIGACLGHELGHAQYQSTMTQEEFLQPRDKFDWEVSAWQQWAGKANVLPIPLHVGKFILDALNTYRRGQDLPEARWQEARNMVEAWSIDPETLSEYEPLEPPEGSPAPKGCGMELLSGRYVMEASEDEPEGDTETEHEPDASEPSEYEPAEMEDEPEPIDHTERDAWLHTGDGMQAAAEGKGKLESKMLMHGWDMENLPAITQAMLEK